MNTPLTVVIIDDEKDAVNALKVVIEEFAASSLSCIGVAHAASEGLQLIKKLQPDVVFLDIQMPHMTGIELAESFDEQRDFEVVFLTAYNNYAHEAFKTGAFHYLLKPIHIPTFLEVVKKLEERKEDKRKKMQQSSLRKAFDDKIGIPSSDGIEFIKISDIIRIEAAGSYAKVFMVNRKPFILSQNLKAMEKRLQHHPFFRTHKSHLIHINYVVKFSPHKDGGTITTADGAETELSRSRKKAFMALYRV